MSGTGRTSCYTSDPTIVVSEFSNGMTEKLPFHNLKKIKIYADIFPKLLTYNIRTVKVTGVGIKG